MLLSIIYQRSEKKIGMRILLFLFTYIYIQNFVEPGYCFCENSGPKIKWVLAVIFTK